MSNRSFASPPPRVGQIRKRDGRVVCFRAEKIRDAVSKAFQATHRATEDSKIELVTAEVVSRLAAEHTPDVEHIQDMVETVLMDFGVADVAKQYILYRAERSRARDRNTKLMQIYQDITFKDAASADIKRENANIDGNTAMGTMLKYGQEGAKQFYEMFVLPAPFADAHREGLIHIHDMDFYTLTTTCCQIDIQKLFHDGFSTGHGTLREPNHIASYAALCCIAVQSNQNDQHGGQSVVNFDYGLAEGVRKTFAHLYRENLCRAFELLADAALDETLPPKSIDPALGVPCMSGNPAHKEAEAAALAALGYEETLIAKAQEFAQAHAQTETERATYKAMVGLVHNLNTMHSRAGAQTPFSSINYGCDTSPEGRCVIRNVLLATEAGLGHGETPIFPIQIFRVKEGINYNKRDPNYDLFELACRVSAKRLFPNFSFLDAPFNAKYYKGTPETEIAYMGCRTRVIANVHDPSAEISNGRGNLSFTSINLPRLAIEAHQSTERFFAALGKTMDLVIDQLLHRFSVQCGKKVRNFPFLMGQHVWHKSETLGWNDDIAPVLLHGTLSVGFIGLAEALVALTGKHHGEDVESQHLGLDIIGFMRDRMDKESAKRKMNFTLIATPAEGLSGRFVRMDRERFGALPNITDKDYYTNSFHIPVGFSITAFDKIRLEAPYHELTNAGHITYVEMDGDPSHNVSAFVSIVRAMKEAGVGYGSINHPIDRDPVCGFSGIIGDSCPGCGRTEDEGGIPFTRIRRITGYLVGSLERFNDAKRAEEQDRVKHS